MSEDIYDDEWAENYARRADAAIPGRQGLYRCLTACFADLPREARILVVGCGTGEELIVLANTLPGATFVAVDPAAPMLEVCHRRLAAADQASRVRLIEGYASELPAERSFAAATSILVAQHLQDEGEALSFFQNIADRLEPEGRLYTADMHIGLGQDRAALYRLWQQQARLAGIEAELVEDMARHIESDLRPRSEEQILSLLQQAGFAEVLKPFSSLLYGAWFAQLYGDVKPR
ncbi:MAG: class I SAM-dependent methyltransferase [Pseudomonadota bacterium]